MLRHLHPVDENDLVDTQFLPAHVFHLARDLRTAVERELAPLDITSQQAALIMYTSLHRGIRPGRVAHPLGTDTAGMTRLVDRLEAKGLVQRRIGLKDRRMIAIQLTDAGRALVPQLRAAFERVNRRVVAGIDEQELGHFRTLMRRLRQNISAAAGEANGGAPC